jgi:hypothetical protein
MKTMKKEFLPGGSKRQYILEKAVDYLKSPGFQGDKHIFCLDILKMSETEYLEALNKATNGALVKDLWN